MQNWIVIKNTLIVGFLYFALFLSRILVVPLALSTTYSARHCWFSSFRGSHTMSSDLTYCPTDSPSGDLGARPTKGLGELGLRIKHLGIRG